jgi:hypothetical protein
MGERSRAIARRSYRREDIVYHQYLIKEYHCVHSSILQIDLGILPNRGGHRRDQVQDVRCNSIAECSKGFGSS